MYYFTVADRECRCDTADELLTVLQSQRSNPSRSGQKARRNPSSKHRAVASGHNVEKTVEKKSKTRRKAKVKVAAYKQAKQTPKNEIKKLPYIVEGISWDVTKRVAQQVGRTDIRQLRHDLKVRKDMGKKTNQ